MSAFNDIRAALEGRIASVSGIPSAGNRAWENVRFNPPTDSAWVRMTLLPGPQRPSVMGPAPQLLYNGLFQIDVFDPAKGGPAAADLLADNIRNAFTVDDSFTVNSTTVRIRFSERLAGRNDPPWYHVPVQVSWYTYRA